MLGDRVNNDVCVEVILADGVIAAEVELLLVIDDVEREEIVVELLLLIELSWLVVVVTPVAAMVIGIAAQALQTAPFHPL